jgi:phytoene dehydrogenase-like protein
MILRGGSGGYDAVIVGGGIGALTAAAYLAQGKGRVLLLEAGTRFGGRAEAIEFAEGFRAPKLAHVAYALDGRAARELRLADHGLEFANPNMKLVALGPGGKHIVLPAAGRRGRASFAEPASQDACAYRSFRDQAMRLARLLRPLWGGVLADTRSANGDDLITILVRRLQLGPRDARQLEELSRLSAASYLDRWFENDALKTALSFDVFPSGLSPQEAGSALVLIWRYAQESCGRQAAVSQIRGGPGVLAGSLEAAARSAGAELRTSARVSSIIVEKRRAIGVTLNGEMIPAGAVLSSLDSRKTLLNLVQADSIGFGMALSVPERGKLATAQMLLALSGPPPFAGLDAADLAARLVIAGRPETASESKSAALNGAFAHELALEVTIPSAADPSLAPASCHVLSALLPYLPAAARGGWQAHREVLRKRVLTTLEGFAPGLKERVVAHRVVTPDEANPGGGMGSSESISTRLLASYEGRMRTPIAGLYLCGETAEPVSAVSGRAGRLAAGLVVMAGQPGSARQ